MDKETTILLNSYQNINSVNIDSYTKFELDNKLSEINEYDIRNTVSATEIFDAEREANEIYRIYGKIEYMSLLNNLKNDYNGFEDFFTPQPSGNSKNIFNSFDFYLVKPAISGYTSIADQTSGDIFFYINEKFDTWTNTTPTDYPVGWNVSVGNGSYIQQTIYNQAELVFSNQIINLITLNKVIVPAYGDLHIKCKIDIKQSLVIGTDILTLILWSNGNIISSHDMLSDGVGDKEYIFNQSPATPITKVTIIGNSNSKNMYINYFQMYKKIPTYTTRDRYIRYFEVIATPKDFELYPIGFTNNIYNEQGYSFNFNDDFDISNYYDEFGFPLTELFLYVQYKRQNTPHEFFSGLKWSNTGIATKIPINTIPFNIGDCIQTNYYEKIGDIIQYLPFEFYEAQTIPQQYYIGTPYIINNQTSYLYWKYNPFIPIRLRYLSDSLYTANTGSTSYELVQSIPSYATEIDGNGNYLWRTILPEGYKDPLTGVGTNNPFVNKRRYLFTSIILDIIPDLDDDNTRNAFSDVWFDKNADIKTITPNSNINNIGKPCQ